MDLKIENLSFRYARKLPEVLSDFSMELTSGGICGLLGPNGSGKSTLLYLIAGALTPQGGEVTFNSVSTRLRRPSTLSDIYLVPEEVSLPPMTLEKYISLYSPFYPNFDRSLFDYCLKTFELDSPGRIDRLSMGQKKKIAISFAFACKTKVLLLDEPTNGLDISAKAAFRTLTALTASDETLTIISTHQVRDIDKLLDRIIIMGNHGVLLNQTVEKIQKHLSFVRDVYPYPADALSAQPTPRGFDAMSLNEGGSESDVNLELLYEYATRPDNRLNVIFAEADSQTVSQ